MRGRGRLAQRCLCSPPSSATTVPVSQRLGKYAASTSTIFITYLVHLASPATQIHPCECSVHNVYPLKLKCVPVCSRPRSPPVVLLHSRVALGQPFRPSPVTSPQSAELRTSTSSLETKLLPMPRHLVMASTIPFAMVRSRIGITWSGTGSRRSSST